MAAIALQAVHRLSEPRTPTPDSGPTPTLGPIDPDIISAAIPAFFIGHNRAGFWVACEARGRIGGLFLFKSSAVDFAQRQSAPARCALVFPTETFELDGENCGNSLIMLAEAAKQVLSRTMARRGTSSSSRWHCWARW